MLEDQQAAGSADNADIDLSRTARRMVRQLPIVVICAILAAAVAFAASARQPKSYESTATIQIGQLDLSALFLGQTPQSNAAADERTANTNAALVTLPNVRERASRKLGGRITPKQLESRVTSKAQTDSNLIEVRATSSNPEDAAEIANAMADAFTESRQKATLDRLNRAREQAEQQLESLGDTPDNSATAGLFRDRLRQIDVLVAAGDNVDIVQGGKPPAYPYAPQTKRNTILGFLAGALLGAAIAMVRSRFDDRITDADELHALWPLPLAGAIPRAKGLSQVGRDLPHTMIIEAFAMVRTNLRYLRVGGEIKTVAVTSAVAEEGKSTVSWNLGVANALAGMRVLIVESDLRRPELGRRLGLNSNAGLAEVLAGMAEAEDVITTVEFGASSDQQSRLGGSIDVIVAGATPPNPIALLEGGRMGRVLDAVKGPYDVVIVDTPPTTVVADTLVIADQVDGVVVVSRIDRARRNEFRRLRDQLENSSTPVLGQIVNGVPTGGTYGYRYGYGYGTYYDKIGGEVS